MFRQFLHLLSGYQGILGSCLALEAASPTLTPLLSLSCALLFGLLEE